VNSLTTVLISFPKRVKEKARTEFPGYMLVITLLFTAMVYRPELTVLRVF
jgi:hypothetical protein